MSLQLMYVVETNLIKVSYCCINHFLHFNSHLKQLYTCNNTKQFSYEGRRGICRHAHIVAFERKLRSLGYRQTASGHW